MSRPKNGTKPRTVEVYHGKREMSFVTSLGVTVHVSPLPPLLPDVVRNMVEEDWAIANKPMPSKPTYTTTNVAGDEQVHEHDEKSLTTEEDKQAWAVYQATQTRFDEEVMTRTFEEHARNGIRFEIDPAWPNRYKRLRPPKDDEAELRWFYTRVAVIGSREDVLQIMTIASRLTGVDEQLINAAEATFRGAVEETHAAPEPAEQAG